MNEDSASRRKDAAWIINPELWPHYPLQPIKRRYERDLRNSQHFGLLTPLAAKGPPYTVHLTLLWFVPCGPLSEGLANVPTKEYATLDDLLNEWTVD